MENKLGVLHRQSQQMNIENETKIKKLHQIIIENGQVGAPPMDGEITSSFTGLNHSIMHTVRKYFSQPPKTVSVKESSLKEYAGLSPENRELWVRAFIAGELFKEFFRSDRKVFGLGGKREDAMEEFEKRLISSGKGRYSPSSNIDG